MDEVFLDERCDKKSDNGVEVWASLVTKRRWRKTAFSLEGGFITDISKRVAPR